jgi:hypothetical protein
MQVVHANIVIEGSAHRHRVSSFRSCDESRKYPPRRPLNTRDRHTVRRPDIFWTGRGTLALRPVATTSESLHWA